tara:strand:- start:47 stop:316 length:270 start_codon:yes stop_codon:yes gene_type:complete
MQNAFPTIGAAVLYLNGFHHGKHLRRLNYLSCHKPDWVMEAATVAWNARNRGPIGDQSRRDFYADLLDWRLPALYAETWNEQVDAKQVH